MKYKKLIINSLIWFACFMTVWMLVGYFVDRIEASRPIVMMFGYFIGVVFTTVAPWSPQ